MSEDQDSTKVRNLAFDADDLLTQIVYSRNTTVTEQLIRFGLTNERFALKVFFKPERVHRPDQLDDRQWAALRKARQYARHEEFDDVEYFPLLLIKYDPDYANGRAQEPSFLRRSYKVTDLNGFFRVPTEDQYGEDIVRWRPGEAEQTYAISKRIYEVRDRLTINDEFIRQFEQESVDGRNLFHEVKAKFLHYVDMDECWATILALWVMGTHVFQQFAAYPYIYLWAEHGSGKSRALKVAAALAHMGKHVEDPSSASAFRLVDAINATLCIDEADKLTPDQNAELLGILNTGYESGALVPRYNVDRKMLEEFNAYSPKMLASNKALGMSLESRCLRIPIARSANKDFAHREPKGGLDGDVLEDMRASLVIWAIDQASALLKLDRARVRAKYEARFQDAPIRLFQIMLPILCLYEFLGLDDELLGRSEQANLAKAIEFMGEEKKASSIPEGDQRILVALYDACCIDSKVSVRCIQEKMQLDDEEWKKGFNASRIGLVLRKYNVPKKAVNGRFYYYPGRSTEERKAEVDALLRKFSVERSEADSTSRQTPEDEPSGLERYGGRDDVL